MEVERTREVQRDHASVQHYFRRDVPLHGWPAAGASARGSADGENAGRGLRPDGWGRRGDRAVRWASDGTNPLPAMQLLQGNPARIAEALKRHFLGEQVETSHNAFLVNTGTKLVLIDAGAGTLLGPHTGDLLNNLRAAGYRPEQVDEIYFTHMHVDHVGGLMVGGQRAFPNAIGGGDKRETDYWLREANMNAAPAEMKRFFQGAIASVTPSLQAGKL